MDQDNQVNGEATASVAPTNKHDRLTLSFSAWWIVGVLGIALIGTIVAWHPWYGNATGERTISVSGTTIIKSEPDEYTFSPRYEFKDVDKSVALGELTAKSDEVVAGLKKVGVADKDIKTDASGYNYYYYFDETTRKHNYTLTITAKIYNRADAQKVQDYLLTTTPTGAVTPYTSFSQTKQKQLESQGRSEATKDARAKAEQQAKNLGFKLGKVKSVADSGLNGGIIYPVMASGIDSNVSKSSSSISVQPGENELTYTVQVVYFIK